MLKNDAFHDAKPRQISGMNYSRRSRGRNVNQSPVAVAWRSLDFINNSAMADGVASSLGETVTGTLRLFPTDEITGMPAGLAAWEGFTNLLPDPLTGGAKPSGWGQHAISQAFTETFTYVSAGKCRVRLQGNASGTVIYQLGAGDMLSVAAADVFVLSAYIRRTSGTLPAGGVSLGFIENDSGGNWQGVFGLYGVDISDDAFPFCYRRVMTNGPKAQPALVFTAAGAFDFEIEIDRPKLVKSSFVPSMQSVNAFAGDDVSITSPETYLASDVRALAIRGLASARPGVTIYSEDGSTPATDYIRLHVDSEYMARLTVRADDVQQADIALGELSPHAPFAAYIEINSAGSIKVRWCADAEKIADAITLPICTVVNLGKGGGAYGNCYIGKVELWKSAANSPAALASAGINLYDAFERPDTTDFGNAVTGQEWVMSLGPGSASAAIADGDYIAVDPGSSAIATYLKTVLPVAPKYMGAVVSFGAGADGGGFGLIASTPGFVSLTSAALHIVFTNSMITFDVVEYDEGTGEQNSETLATRTYPNALPQDGTRCGIAWAMVGDSLRTIDKFGVTDQHVNARFDPVRNPEAVFELYRIADGVAVPTCHAVMAA